MKKEQKTARINPETLKLYADTIKTYRDEIKAGKALHVSISNANSKMGNVASVSLMPGITCPYVNRCKGTCGSECYAAKLCNLRPSVRKAWARNTAIYQAEPDRYWEEVNAAIAAVRFFRFHVDGEIISGRYFAGMVESACRNPGTQILVFTKRWEVVSAWIDANGALPENLHVLFSGWEGMQPINPHNLSETNVYDRHAEPDPSWLLCGGNCFNCACRGVGCWQAKRGDVIAFEKH